MLAQPKEAAELMRQASRDERPGVNSDKGPSGCRTAARRKGRKSVNAALLILHVVMGLGIAAHGAEKL